MLQSIEFAVEVVAVKELHGAAVATKRRHLKFIALIIEFKGFEFEWSHGQIGR